MQVTTGTSQEYNVWDASGPPVGNNRYVLWCIFSNSQPEPNPGSFGFNDNIGDDVVVPWQYIECSSSKFAKEGEDDTAKGIRVYPQHQRYLWFKFHTPLATSTTVQQVIPVIIRAIKDQ